VGLLKGEKDNGKKVKEGWRQRAETTKGGARLGDTAVVSSTTREEGNDHQDCREEESCVRNVKV